MWQVPGERLAGVQRSRSRDWQATDMNPALVPYPPFVRRAALAVALILAGGIAYMSLVPGGTVPAPYLSDKIRHFGAYAMLAIPAAMWFGPGRWAAVGVLTVYGAGLEVAQAVFTATREASVLDGLANALGATAGVLLVWFIARTRAKTQPAETDRLP